MTTPNRPICSSRSRAARSAAVAAALIAALLTGCSQSSESASSDPADRTALNAAESAADSEADSGARSDMASAVDAESTSMITTASVSVVVADPAEAAAAVSELVDQSGGRVSSRNESAASTDEAGSGWAELTVRVPADRLTETIGSLASIGSVEHTSITSTDVSGQVTDVAARIEALEVSATRLETLMAAATSTAELLEAEATLTQRQSDLESLQAQRDQLADQVSMSTLTLSLTTAPVVTSPTLEPSGFVGGLSAGWDALTSTLNVIVVALGAALPWLVLAGAGYVVVRWVRRRVRRGTGNPIVNPAARQAEDQA